MPGARIMDLNHVDRSGAPVASPLGPPDTAIGSLHQTSALQTTAEDSITSLNRSSSALDAESGVKVPAAPHEIVFIDKGVADYQTLAAGVNSNAEVVLLDSQQDGIAQISRFLQQRHDVSAIHIVSHGNAGSLHLGNTDFNAATATVDARELQGWSTSLTADADILLYGCDVALGQTGQSFVRYLSQLTQADVAASTNLTGSVGLGGDWNLEVNTGAIAAQLAFRADAIATYNHTLLDLTNTQYDNLKSGITSFLDTLQAGVNLLALGKNLPLVGDKLKNAEAFFQNVRDQIAAGWATVDGLATKTDTAIQTALTTALAGLVPGGITIDPIDDNSDGTPDRIQFNTTLVRTLLASATPIGFSTGLPGVGLAVDGNVNAQTGYDFKFNVGVDLTSNEFYVDTATANELKIDLNIATPGLSATGTLGFLQVNAQDVDDPANPTDQTHLTGEFAINLSDPNSDGRLTAGELTAIGSNYSQFISPKLTADARINLDLTASFGGSAKLPSLKTNFNLGWAFSPSDPDLSGSAPTVAFNNVRLDLGTFFDSF